MSQHAILSWQASATSRNVTLTHECGEAYTVDPLTVVRRFLILGSTGTFYATATDVTKQATGAIDTAIADDPRAVLDLVCEISDGNLALKKDPQLYVLAKLTAPAIPLDVRRDAAMALATVARTGTDLLHWMAYRYAGRKSNRLFRRAVTNWLLARTPDQLALQAVKYDQRDGWTMRDVLRLAKPKAPNAEYAAVFDWMAHPEKRTGTVTLPPNSDGASRLFMGYAQLRVTDGTPADYAATVGNLRLPREAIPGELLAHREVWTALFPDMPGRALLRNLGKLGSLGFFDDLEGVNTAVSKIAHAVKVCHPFEFLIAAKMYDSGQGLRGSLTWTPNRRITDALAMGFGAAFANLPVHDDVRPLVALDVSGSMTCTAGGTVLSCIEAEAALAAVLAYQYPQARFVAFSHQLAPIEVRGKGYQDVLRDIGGRGFAFGGTYLDLPLAVAERDLGITAVVTITDNETHRRNESPSAIVKRIHASGREQFRHGVVAMAANDISVADPADPRQMDFVGMDASLPRALSLFLNGEA